MLAIDITRWMLSLLDQLQHNRQRQLVTLQGPQSWCDDQLEKLRQLDPELLLFSNRSKGNKTIPFSKAETCLGSEARLVVIDLFGGFNPDVLCIASGLVQAAGVLLLLSPPLEDWDLDQDEYAIWQDQARSTQARFVEYFFTALEQDPELGIKLTPESTEVTIPELASLQETIIDHNQTAEQAQTQSAVEQWIDSKRQGIVLISADRGRGKSTCLGQLINRIQTRHKVLVSASSRAAATQLLHWAPLAEFVAPDRLVQNCPEADLLVIDEAAMIPQSILRQLGRCYRRMVLATTRDGYEGTGQGFMLRFVAGLDRDHLLQLEMHKPVRWCQGDHLEIWIHQTLLLTQKFSEPKVAQDNSHNYEFKLIEDPGKPEQLPLLRQVYALLAGAHYRTRPSDLRMLMENPDLVLIVAVSDDRLVAAALLNKEGGLDETLCNEIFLGQRRPRGHLLAQMLTARAGVKNFACYRGLRIQRIAVAEAWRRRGLATQLLERAMHYADEKQFDYLGASFALDPDTVCFWRQAEFALVHVSYAQGKSSGSHSIAVLKPLTQPVVDVIELLQQRMQQQMATWMTQFLQTMDASHVTVLLRYANYHASISEIEQNEIDAFASGSKGFELCFASLQKFVMQRIVQSATTPDHLLIEKTVQNRNWGQLERKSGSEGREHLQQRLRGLVEALIKAC